MKKNLLLLMALSVSSLTMWSQEPLCLNDAFSPITSSLESMAVTKFMPEAVNISGVECQLDRYVVPNKKMEEYIYDGNTILCNRYVYDWTTNDWSYVAKSNSVYNQDGRLTFFESYDSSTNANQWKGKVKYEYEYDFNGHIIASAKFLWSDSANNWYCKESEESLFSDSGLKVSSAKWFGSESSLNAKAGLKTELTQYANGDIKEKINYAWDEQLNDWTLSDKESYKYNSRGNTSESLKFVWNPSSQSWEQSEGHQYTFTYGIKGKKTSVIEKVWDKTTDEWEAKYITSFGYDQNSCKILRVRAYATSEDPLNGFEKDTYEYNEFNQVILHNAYVTSKGTNELWLSYKDEYTYDEFRNVSSFVRYKWLEGNPESFGWQKWERVYTDERKPAMRADYKWDSQSKSWVGKCRQQLSNDELGLDIDLAERYDWTPEGWLKSSYEKVELDAEKLMATVTEYDSASEQVLSEEFYYYKPIGTTGITEALQGVEPVFNIEGNCISTTDNVTITIYSIDGKLINSSANKVEVPCGGFYIVKVGEKASKVYVK